MDENYICPYLKTHELVPENQETPLKFLKQWVTPLSCFFIRNHFAYPAFREAFYSLEVGGEVDNPTIFSLADIKNMPSKTMLIALECSGNKRAFFKPDTFGTQWEEGAISQGYWTGVPLKHLLSTIGVSPKAYEVVFHGHDYGLRTDKKGLFHYARSLPLNIALHDDTMIAYQLNEQDIPFKHGYPLRLIVPEWYGMSWVKWLKSITIIPREFTGPFQKIDYQYYPDKESDRGKHPVTYKNVNSTILSPLNLAVVSSKRLMIEGLAWTGKGVVKGVEVSIDEGKTWKDSTIYRLPSQRYAWVFWRYDWDITQKGEYTLWSRARDSEGRIQPEEPYWNRMGYGYNAVSRIKVKIE